MCSFLLPSRGRSRARPPAYVVELCEPADPDDWIRRQDAVRDERTVPDLACPLDETGRAGEPGIDPDQVDVLRAGDRHGAPRLPALRVGARLVGHVHLIRVNARFA